ncbi:MAG TPA: hypothetical protein VK481_01705 [Gemmatimonadaceae bacterium]|nr:hypothetical protein [Gemmatimonadaceae bacterium]
MSIRSVYMVSLAFTLACASTGGAGGGAPPPDRNLLTEDEISTISVASAYEAVERLRPMFLKTRGRSTINAGGSEYATVFVNGQFYGDLPNLRNIMASEVREIRYLNGPDAVTKYGMRYGSGAIDVRIK